MLCKSVLRHVMENFIDGFWVGALKTFLCVLCSVKALLSLRNDAPLINVLSVSLSRGI